MSKLKPAILALFIIAFVPISNAVPVLYNIRRAAVLHIRKIPAQVQAECRMPYMRCGDRRRAAPALCRALCKICDKLRYRGILYLHGLRLYPLHGAVQSGQLSQSR